MKDFSKNWESSKKPGKQRKHRLKAPLHTKHRFLHSHLSKELREKYGKRSIGLRKGDKVKVMKGRFRKHEGKIDVINLKSGKVMVSGADITKKDGSKKPVYLKPSNVMVTELNLDDKFRQEILARK